MKRLALAVVALLAALVPMVANAIGGANPSAREGFTGRSRSVIEVPAAPQRTPAAHIGTSRRLITAERVLNDSAPVSAPTKPKPKAKPTPATGGGRCPEFEPLLITYAPPEGWDIALMSRIMFRESRCHPTSRSRTHDSGLLQINDVHLPSLSAAFGVAVTPDFLYDPINNIKAAALLCGSLKARGRDCYAPWGF